MCRSPARSLLIMLCYVSLPPPEIDDHVCVCGAAVASRTYKGGVAGTTDQTDDPLDIGHEFQITGSTISSNESRGRGTSWEFGSFSTSEVCCMLVEVLISI